MPILRNHDSGPWHASSMLAFLAGMLALASLPGCGNTSDAPHTGDVTSKSDSLFGTSTVQARAVIISEGQVPYPLESLAIHGSPASDVKQALAPVLTRLNEGLRDVQTAIDATQAELERAKEELAAVTAEIDAEHKDRLPEASAKPGLSQRNAVKLLEKWRAQEIAANKWHKDATAERTTPLRGTIAGLEREIGDLSYKMVNLRKSFVDEVFQGLPSRPKKTWKTNSNGLVSLAVPNSEPWIVWAASSRTLPNGRTERYRWICRLPDELDSNGGLFLDHANLLDKRGIISDAFLERSTPSP